MNKHVLTKQQAERLDKWTAALRSGNYKQCKEGSLRENDAFCCLGVLCDISGLGHWDNDSYVCRSEDGLQIESTDFPPMSVIELFGLPDQQATIGRPDFDDAPTYVSLVDLNDGSESLAEFNDGDLYYQSATFDQIADHIDRWKREDCEIVDA